MINTTVDMKEIIGVLDGIERHPMMYAQTIASLEDLYVCLLSLLYGKNNVINELIKINGNRTLASTFETKHEEKDEDYLIMIQKLKVIRDLVSRLNA